MRSNSFLCDKYDYGFRYFIRLLTLKTRKIKGTTSIPCQFFREVPPPAIKYKSAVIKKTNFVASSKIELWSRTQQVFHENFTTTIVSRFYPRSFIGCRGSPEPSSFDSSLSSSSSWTSSLKELRHRSCILKRIAKLFKIVISNPFRPSPSSAILVPYCFRITPLVFSFISKSLVLGFQTLNRGLRRRKNYLKYRDVAPLT